MKTRVTRVILILKTAVSVGLMIGLMVLAWRLGLGRRPDPEVVRLLNSPSAVERFATQVSTSAEEKGTGKRLLVVEAEALALILNPPKPPKPTPLPPKPRAARTETALAAAPAVAPKFRLTGISYHRSKPEQSKALVWEASGSSRWVAAGEQFGHLTIRQINGDSIVYEDAAGMHEMAPIWGQQPVKL